MGQIEGQARAKYGIAPEHKKDAGYAVAKAGIICLTPENLNEPWILFEAGAISKSVKERTLVCPFLFDLTPTDLKGPLAQFQAVISDNKEQVKKMMSDFNAHLEKRLDVDRIQELFDVWWPAFRRAN